MWHLRHSGRVFHTSAEVETVRQMKESACFVSQNPEREEGDVRDGKFASTVDYTLPDGQTIALGPERFRAAEVLFQPHLLGVEYPGIAEAVSTSVLKADLELRKTLLANVVLAGGTTAMPGFGARLLQDVRKLTPSDTTVKIWASKERKVLAWIGGSILASLGTFKAMCVSKAEWEEEGARALHRLAGTTL